MERLVKEVGADRFSIDDDIAKVALVGAGMKSHPGVAVDMFNALALRVHQHRDDLDVADPYLVCDPQIGRRARGAGDPRAVRTGRAGGGAVKVAVVGATGAVGVR